MTAIPNRTVIRASAGAGKTYQLVSQYVRRLHAGVDPSAMLAVTFTRKAAGEILASTVARLIQAASDPEKRAELAQVLGDTSLSEEDCQHLLRRLVGSLHRLSVGTIDSFFHRLASVFRWELDLPIDPLMADALDPEVAALRQDVIADVLAAGDPAELTDLFRRHHGNRAARAVGQALDALVIKLHDVWRLAPERDTWDCIEVPDALTTSQLTQAITDLEALGDEVPVTASGKPDSRWTKAHAAHMAAARSGDWATFLDRGIVSHLNPESGTFYKKEIPQAWWDVCAPLVQHAKAVLLQELRQKHLASHDLLTRFDEAWHRLRRGRRLLMFSDLTTRLARDLPAILDGALPRVRHRLDTQTDHMLLDEFQDTSPSQWQILEPFADSLTSTESGDRSLFVVGDVKQAIYGWRGGNAALFGEIEHRYEVPAQDLATSYRSVPVVMDLVNEVFGTVSGSASLAQEPADTRAAHRFEDDFRMHESAGHLAGRPGYAVLRSTAIRQDDSLPRPDELLEAFPEAPAHVVISEEEDLDAPTSHEDFVARYVAKLYSANPRGSIAVLVRTNVVAENLLHHLRRTRADHSPLPVSGEGGAPLSGSPPVAAFLSAFALADSPSDLASAYHVATSPLGPVLGLTIANYREEAATVSQKNRRELQRAGYAAVVGSWIPAVASACDHESLDRLQQLLELAQSYEPTTRPIDFVHFVESTRVEQGTTAPIRVMTIHAAKGLEFDTVVLPELDNRPRYVYPVMLDRDSQTGPPVGILPYANKGLRSLSPQLNAVYEQERERRCYEDLCVLYVALTRARRAVHMLVRPKTTSHARLYTDLLRDMLAPDVPLTEDGDQILYEVGERDWWGAESDEVQPGDATAPTPTQVSLKGLPAPAGRRRAWPALSPSSLEGGGRVSGADLLASAGGDARARGLVFHEWFQMVGFLDQPEGVPSDPALRASARQQAPELPDGQLEDWIADFRRVLGIPAIREVLERNGAHELWTERAFALRANDQLLQGRFDRVAIWADRALIVDFKTDVAGPSARDKYQPQVDFYRQAVCSLLGLPEAAVEARLAFVATGDVLRL